MQGTSQNCFKLTRARQVISVSERMILGNAFVKKIALKGGLKKVLSSKDYRIALKTGQLPKNFNIHHYFPLAMGGKHQESNLCIIDKKLHQWIHAYLLDPIYRDYKFDFSDNKKAYLLLPEKKNVFTMDDASIFFTDEELHQIKEDEKNGVVPVYVSPDVDQRDKISMLRFVEQLKKEMDLLDQDDRKKSEELIDGIMHQIREENTVYRREGKKIRKSLTEHRMRKTKIPLTRREKAIKSAKKARKSAVCRFYPHLVARVNQKERS